MVRITSLFQRFAGAALVGAAALLAASSAHAFSGYLDTFNTLYGTGGTPLDNCGLCHNSFQTSGNPGNRNPYGADFEAQPGRTAADLMAIESVLSDGDTTNNLGEINQGFFPGWDCNTYTTAGGNPPANFADLVDPDNVGCGGNQPPVADADGPYSGTAGVTVITFDGSGSFDPDGNIVSYDWDFGDGNTGTGVSPTNTYAAAGDYTVTLVVTDDAGDTGTDTSTAAIVAAPQDPIADPNGPYDGFTGQPVAFDGSGSFDPDGGNITQYDWDFGDGNTGTGVSPSHTYATMGDYTVTLTVVDDEGATSAPATTSATIIDITPQECIALGGLAWDSWQKTDAGGSGQLPPDEPDADYTRCKACHGWDQQGTDGGYVRRSRNAGRANAGYQDPNNCDLPGADLLTCTPSRNISTDPIFGSGSPITIPAGGRSWAEGSAVFDMVDPSWGPGAILGNRHPDLTAAGGPTAQQLDCLEAFLNAPEARADQVFAAMDTSANPVIYTPVATADATAGEVYYADNCSGCHGAPDADSTAVTDFLPGVGGMIGYLNQDGKYSEFMHKMHWGIPNTTMTRAAMGDPTAADVADVVAYMQSFMQPLVVDLDIKKFQVSKKGRLGGNPVRVNLTVRNAGDVDEPRRRWSPACRTGLPFTARPMDVSDAPGNGSTRWDFPSFTPTLSGDINWTATIADGDPDDDTATATTSVR